MTTHSLEPTKYSILVRIIHWTFIPLIICSIVTGKIMTQVGFDDPLSYYLPQYHYLSGLTLFTLLFSRIISRLFSKTPIYNPAISQLNMIIAKSIQALMLITISFVLVSGYLLATADGNPAKLPWGLWLIQISPDDGFTLELMLSLHIGAIITFFVLLFVHVVGFIKQQISHSSFIKRIL